MSDNDFESFDGLARDPLTALRATGIPGFDAPIAPDAAFAAALRDRLERGAILPKGVVMTDVPISDGTGHGRILTEPSKANTAGPIRTGDIGYFSLQSPDAARAARFYGEVLGWEYQPDTRQVTNLGHSLGISQAGDYGINTIFCAYAVDDFDSAREAIVTAGGTAGEVSTAGDGVHVMECTDDAGVAFAVYVPGDEDPRPDQHPRGVGEMSYLTILTSDSARFRDFYGAVLGWTFEPGRMADGWEVAGARPQVGVAGGQDSEVAVAMWNVVDIDNAVVRVRDAGGEVISEPETQVYGIMALCADDQGAQFYLGQLF